mmetsp:Transcript_4831/g.10384  ORF Transcript_4831/g.10384 Transcript_4831/m.10384 type:complete len:284 (-) Transcript_4831:39-890(-)
MKETQYASWDISTYVWTTKSAKIQFQDLIRVVQVRKARKRKHPKTYGGSLDLVSQAPRLMCHLSFLLGSRQLPHLECRAHPYVLLNLLPGIRPSLQLTHQRSHPPTRRLLLQPNIQQLLQQAHQHVLLLRHQQVHRLPRCSHPNFLPIQPPHLLFQLLRFQHFLQQYLLRIIRQPTQPCLLQKAQPLHPFLLLRVFHRRLPLPLPPSPQLFPFRHFLRQCHQHQIQQKVQCNWLVRQQHQLHPEFQVQVQTGVAKSDNPRKSNNNNNVTTLAFFTYELLPTFS